MTVKCDKCNLEIKDANETRDGDIVWFPDGYDKSFHDWCWPEVESKYRLDKDGKVNFVRRWTYNKIINGVGGGTQEDWAYDWNQKKWRRFTLADNPKDWGSPPTDKNNNPTERERERETNPTITNSDCWIRGYN